MENQKISKKFRILLMGEYRNLFIRGAFPSLKKRKNKEYKKIIHYNNNIIELSIIDIDDPSLIVNYVNKNNNKKEDGIIALFVIDATNDNNLIEINSTIDDLKSNYTFKDISINEFILLGIIPKNYNVEQNILEKKEDSMPLLVFHKLAEKQKCFCYEMDESEEEIDYNLFFVNYAMFFWLEFDKIYSNEELKEIIEKNSGNENKDIKIKYFTEKELKNLEEKKKKNLSRELSLISKENDRIETSKKKLIKIKAKEENKKHNIIMDSLKKRYLNKKNNNSDESRDKFKKNNNNIWDIIEESKKEKLIELYNKENPSILRCIYCYEIPEIQIIHDKYIKIKCKNHKDQNHIGKENLIDINVYKKLIFEQQNDYDGKIKQINYNKNKCIYCGKNQKDIIKDFINFEQKESENSYTDLKNHFFYYYNENKMFFCNICREFICQKCKNFHLLFCTNKHKVKDDNINSYENYDEIKNLIDERIIDYENEVNLNKQFMPLYMFDTFCIKHKKLYNYYCENCKINLCSECIDHNNHNILNWVDLENILILKKEDLQREKNIINSLGQKIAKLILDLNDYLHKLLQKQMDLINFKEKFILNGTYIDNNYYVYKNLKNIEFNMKYFDEDKYKNENNIMNKLSIILDYFNEPHSIITNNLFNEITEEKLVQNTSLINDNIIQNKISINNSYKQNYHITSFIYFNENEMENIEKIDNNENNCNIFAFSTDNGDANFYKIEENGKTSRFLSINLFQKNEGIFDMKKIKYNRLLFGGYEHLKIIDIQLSTKRYNIISIIKKQKSYFIKNWVLNKNMILSYFSNKVINLIKYYNNSNKNEMLPWTLLDNNSSINEKISCIENKSYELISLIKLKKRNNQSKFIITVSNNETFDNNKDLLLFYHIDKIKNKIFLEKYLYLPKINKNENNVFELAKNNLIICLLGTQIQNAAIINLNNYIIEKIIKLNDCNFCLNKIKSNYCNYSIFKLFCSIKFMDNYYLSFNNNLELIQWKYDYDNTKFIPIDNLSFNFIKRSNRLGGNKFTNIKNLLFFQKRKILIGVTNDDLIFSVILEV